MSDVREKFMAALLALLAEGLGPAMDEELGKLERDADRAGVDLAATEVLVELERCALERVAIARRAVADGIARCASCGSERPIAELKVNIDGGDVVCATVEACRSGSGLCFAMITLGREE